ncbi:glycosyl transferase family 2 [Leptolyngbya sp. Heron Island J]|uniref:glycosyltransferase n=1 Tax=Leptolyngbya sp. Heron Island J TaxID=1385935 RepID=UPI0003B93F16|nr:glycosyltransferase [Leptolyngbya sp. Heron Island J]ESA36731.1 glycosyl transferase family 2 [Leptolyngbya sp. Heron Island J]
MPQASMVANEIPVEPVTFCPTVSVIVPIYNGETDLPGLIECLLAQTYPANRVEYLLVDNDSCDRTPKILQAAVTQAQAAGLTLKHLSETEIQSAYAARNTGIRAATGEILAFTDADCYPAATWLANLVQGFQDSAVGLCVGEIIALPGTTWLERYAERKNIMSQQDTLDHPFCPYGQTANIAVRACAFEKIGLFRPHMTTGGDADICWRLQRDGGWQLHYDESAVVQHHHRATLKELYKQWYRYGRSNRYLHQLHGIKLTRPLLPREVRYATMRWVAKELPAGLLKLLVGKADLIDLAMTPIGLYCFRARTLGQRESRLPEEADKIAWLESD